MNKTEANAEAKKIAEWYNKESDRIIQEAKKNGSWQQGLDANRHLFVELNAQTKEKLEHLKSLIDE